MVFHIFISLMGGIPSYDIMKNPPLIGGFMTFMHIKSLGTPPWVFGAKNHRLNFRVPWVFIGSSYVLTQKLIVVGG